MLTTAHRIIRSGFVNFWRNSFISLAAVLVMTVTLLVVGAIIFLGATLSAALEQLQSKVDINVYFVPGAPVEQVGELEGRLKALPEVESVVYVSEDEALAQFRERHADDPLTLQALDELGENPLGASLSIKARETSQYEGIAAFLEGEHALSAQGDEDIIDSVNYFDNKAAIDKLSDIIGGAETLGLAITLFLAVASVIIVFNTIRLAIYTARDEIGVMRLVGASRMYIRGPFVFEGILYGIASAFIALIVFYPVTFWLGPRTEEFFGNINLLYYYLENFGQIFAIIVGSGILLGAISSFLAVRKYLKV